MMFKKLINSNMVDLPANCKNGIGVLKPELLQVSSLECLALFEERGIRVW